MSSSSEVGPDSAGADLASSSGLNSMFEFDVEFDTAASVSVPSTGEDTEAVDRAAAVSEGQFEFSGLDFGHDLVARVTPGASEAPGSDNAQPESAPDATPDPDFRRERKFTGQRLVLNDVAYEGRGRVLYNVTLENGNSVVVDKAWGGESLLQYKGLWVSAAGKWSISRKTGMPELRLYQAEPSFPTFSEASITALQDILVPAMLRWSGEEKSVLSLQTAYRKCIREMVESEAPGFLNRLMADFTPCLEAFGQTDSQKTELAQAWLEATSAIRLRRILTASGFNQPEVDSIVQRWREKTYEVLRNNPYAIVSMGFSVDKAERLVKTFKAEPARGTRMIAHMRNALNKIEGATGSTAIRLDALLSEILVLEPLDLLDIQTIISAMKATKDDLDVTVKTAGGMSYCGIGKNLNAESAIASWVSSTLNRTRAERRNSPDAYQRQYQRAIQLAASALRSIMPRVSLDPIQVEAVARSAVEPVSILTGGPGTGKSTVSKALVMVLEQMAREASHNGAIHLGSPTGKAAVRLTEMSGQKANTMHAMLGLVPDHSPTGFMKFGKHFGANDMVLIDESSMMDSMLMHALVQSCPQAAGPGFRLVFIGDDAQLDPVGAGRPLADMLGACAGSTSRIPVTRLINVHRQAENGGIALGASLVRRKKIPEIPKVASLEDITPGNTGRLLVKSSEAGTIIRREYEAMMERGEDPGENAVVLSPMRKGPGGVYEANQILSNLLNADGRPIMSQDRWRGDGPIPRVGDRFITGKRIVQQVDGKASEIVNSATGKIVSMLDGGISVVVDGEDRPRTLDPAEMQNLMVGYAITIHKSQGSQYKNVIMPVFMEHETMLDNQLFYTGWTRAIDRLLLVGDQAAIEHSITTDKGRMRKTTLRVLLEDTLSSDPTATAIASDGLGEAVEDRDIIRISMPGYFSSTTDDEYESGGATTRRRMTPSPSA